MDNDNTNTGADDVQPSGITEIDLSDEQSPNFGDLKHSSGSEVVPMQKTTGAEHTETKSEPPPIEL